MGKEVDSVNDIHWWSGVIYGDYCELMLDINKDNTRLRSHCFIQERKNITMVNWQQSSIFLLSHQLVFTTFLLLYVIDRRVTGLDNIVLERMVA